MNKEEFKKMTRGLGTSGTTFNVPTSDIEVPEGKEEEQQI